MGDTLDAALNRDWISRWEFESRGHRNQPPEPANDPRFGEDPPDKHVKHESSELAQMRTGKIGLTAFHLVAECRETTESRQRLSVAPEPLRTTQNFAALLPPPH